MMESEWPGNYLPSACRGCVIVHRSHPAIVGIFPVPEESGSADDAFQWDPKSKVFTVVNARRYPCFTYLTFLGTHVRDRNGQPFELGFTRSDEGVEEMAITFVVVADPMTAVRLGKIEAAALPSTGFFAIELEQLQAPSVPAALHIKEDPEGYAFPLPDVSGPYLCTQGIGGHLTHFFPESYHAVDLRCATHTPVLSIGDGIVKDIAQTHKCGGIHAANLAKWNSISVILESGIIVEYLHTLAETARVEVGEEVRRGQVLCESGDIGFAPEPHLHVELHSAADPDGPSLPLHFGKQRFVPTAGRWYNSAGEAEAPQEAAPMPPPVLRLGGGGGIVSKSRRRLQRLERLRQRARTGGARAAQAVQRTGE
ncbi:unnamed protein product [Symbiodinium pilosum]|uniref:M23ase beta-sheet core domain-containing protein n=1 Tax=Symbiodinium pilosum TaxID=2952 RepID=A0A812NCJ3_SYMPI|nr:unnamed protein product [Symbiodinium pilosum]